MKQQGLVHSPDGVHTEIFRKPSRETILLIRVLGGLVSPRDGKPSFFNRVLGAILIAPFTQLSVMNYELQDYLFRIFHVKIWSRISHAIFMPVLVFFMMVFFAQFRWHGLPAEPGWHQFTFNGAYVYAVLLILWYLALAMTQQFYLWWWLTVPMVLLMAWGADLFFCAYVASLENFHWYAPTDLIHNPLLWMAVSANVLSLSHITEWMLPPRAVKSWHWVSFREAVMGEPSQRGSVVQVLRGLGQLAFQFISGAINEWWASPRLMPYNWLMLMFALGYKPEINQVQQDYADRAWASGNPALDYIGIGGGAYLNRDAVKAHAS
jgi:hypothetical protein